MYNIGDIFYFDKNNVEDYSKRADFCNQNNFRIVEIEADEIGRRYQIQEVPKPTDKELNQIEMKNLINWFNDTYTYKEQKYRRLHSLGKLTDEGKDPYNELINIYNEAEIKRARIQELEVLINDSSK